VSTRWRRWTLALAAIAIPAEAAWVLYVIALGTDAGLPLYVVLACSWGVLGLLVFWAVRLALYLVATREARETRRWRPWALEPSVLVACTMLVWSGVGFRARFLVSRGALARYVQSPLVVAPSFPPTTGPQIGLFRVRESEVLPDGVVRMITTDCMFDHCGLVYSPQKEPPVIGEDIYTALGSGWWQWWRSW
jgi:hypothetical protein